MSDPELVVHPQLRWRRPFAAAVSALEGSRNCACAVGAAFVEWATRGAKRPTHHDFRVAAGDPRNSRNEPRGLASVEVARAYRHFGVEVTRHFGESFSVVREALQAGHGISACVDYPLINAESPALSGQRTFMGGHHVGLLGFTPDDPKAGGLNSTVVHDPLFDGRTKAWGTAPNGPQPAPVRVYRRAMGAFRVGGPTYPRGHPIGDNLGVFLIVKRAPPSTSAPAAIGRSATQAQVAALTAENADLRAQLAAAQQQIAQLKARLDGG